MAHSMLDWDSRLVRSPHGLSRSSWAGSLGKLGTARLFEAHEPSDCFAPDHLPEPPGDIDLEQLSIMISTRLEQALQFRRLEEQLTDLTERVTHLERNTNTAKAAVTTAIIQTLAPEPYCLLRPIEVSIEGTVTGEFIAAFFDANITTSGDNEQEAFENIKGLVLDMFDSLSAEREEKLGPEPARQLAVLREFIRPV